MNVASQHSFYSLRSAVSFICKSAYLWHIVFLLCIVKNTDTTFIFKAQLELMQAGELTAGRLYTQFTNWNSSSGSAFNCFGRHFRSRRYRTGGTLLYIVSTCIYLYSPSRAACIPPSHRTQYTALWCHKYLHITAVREGDTHPSLTMHPFTAE